MEHSYKNSQTLFQGKRIAVFSIEIEENRPLEMVSHPGAVVLLPLLDPQTVILIRNQRYAVQETLWELPAGTLEKNEKPLACAARELEEETGYRTDKLSFLLKFYSTPGFCNEILFVYLAQDLTYVGQNLQEGEQIEVIPHKLSHAIEMVCEGIICDAKTIAALLFYNEQLARKE